MHPQRRKRLILSLCIITGVAIAATLALYALRQSINLYYTPTQLAAAGMPEQQEIRVGGLVKKGSVVFAPAGVEVNFILTDYQQQILVKYNGVLPALFREGQGIVAEGKLNQQHAFVADQVLAKHDENYKPPGIK